MESSVIWVGEAGTRLAARLHERDVTVAPAVMNLVENRAPQNRHEVISLLEGVSPATLGGEAPAHIVGVTGPPGVGKSTLLSALVRAWRVRNRSVAILAVDPSSARSGGALLGDRVRIGFYPRDREVFIRSMGSAGRLGGLAPATRDAAHALAVAFDVVVIETVGIGQTQTEVADVADTVVVVVQPGSGDVLQFLKSGIMEIPDVLVVTKADLGPIAHRARRDLEAATRTLGATDVEVLAVSSIPPPRGFAELIDAIDKHRASIDIGARRLAARRASALADFAFEHGERGVRALGGKRQALHLLDYMNPLLDIPTLIRALERLAV